MVLNLFYILTYTGGKMINYFWNNYKFLSNFYPCRVIMDGLEYNSTEHAYQAAKTLDSKYRATIAALPGDKAAKAKRMGSEKGRKLGWNCDLPGRKSRKISCLIYSDKNSEEMRG